MSEFSLNSTLEADTHFVADIGLCKVLLMNDARYPWLIMVPRRANLEEVHDLTPLDQTVLTFEIAQMSEVLKNMTKCTKINVGALGNIVRQLHIHIIARNENDAAWPGPVWGNGKAAHYQAEDVAQFKERFSAAMLALD